jgi:hypothetical protein
MHLENKARIRIVCCTGQNPLSWNERLVYSKLVFLAGLNKGADYKKQRRETGLNLQRTIPRIVERLNQLSLVEQKDGKWWAKTPPEPAWFGWIRSKKALWHHNLAYWWLYRPGPELKRNEALVWSLVASYDRPMTVKGLARLLNRDPKTIRKAVAGLQAHGLLQDMRAIVPLDKLGLFRDRSSSAYRLSDRWQGFPVDKSLELRIRMGLDSFGQTALNKGWSRKAIMIFCAWLAKEADSEPSSILWRICLDLPKLFSEAQKEHEANVARGKYQRAANCAGLFTLKVRRAFIKQAKIYRKLEPKSRQLFLEL